MTEPHQRNMVECSQRPVQTSPEALEGKAAAFWTSGTYGGVCEHGQGAICLRACASKRASAHRREAAFSLRSYFGEVGPAKAGGTPLAAFFNTLHMRKNLD